MELQAPHTRIAGKGVPLLDAWAKALNLILAEPLVTLKNARIGVDATYYLQQFLNPPAKEPLNPALGGFPLGLGMTITKELKEIAESGCQFLFVFDGLDHGSNDDPFKTSNAAVKANSMAFETYEKDMAMDAIGMFRTTGIPTPRSMEEFLKKTLHDARIAFTVAPFSALAQLAYYALKGGDILDAVMGPSEIFLYGMDSIITSFSLAHETHEIVEESGYTRKDSKFVLEDSTFSWLGRQAIMNNLGPTTVPVEAFIDSMLLAGSTQLESFPPLNSVVNFPQPVTFPSVVTLLMSCGQKVSSICKMYREDPSIKEHDYYDKYLRATTAIRHHIVITKNGSIEPIDNHALPDDLHDCVGLRLPEELLHYLSRGMIRPRVLNWLTSGTVHVMAPNEGGESVEYQNLVNSQLRPLREQAIGLIASYLNNYYQRKDIATKYWTEDIQEHRFGIKAITSPNDALSKWFVKEDTIQKRRSELDDDKKESAPDTLFFAVRSLSDPKFVSETLKSKPSEWTPLSKPDEVVSNAIWRFLYLRGYVDDKHKLTTWGKFLEVSLDQLGSGRDQAESVFVCIELIRFGILTLDTMFPNYSGAPLRGSAEDKRNCMLLARLACTGKVCHKPKGYSGPLSRHLLAYYSIVAAVRASLRDLVEVCLLTMFLNGEVDQERDDLMALSLSLPFHNENNCALAIMTKTYLDELASGEYPTSETNRSHFKQKGEQWFIQSYFEESINSAFNLWDAVYTGLSKTKELEKYHSLWEEVNTWTQMRR